MDAKQNYGGLDAFRFTAAFLVIAIHTSPLANLSTNADFFLTNVLARLAVPFFFMVTGQFILSDYLFDHGERKKKNVFKIWRFIKKSVLLYAVTILIYLPVGLYTERYDGITLRSALQMLIFDGTFYHLWYFPACIVGILIVYLLHHILSFLDMASVQAMVVAVSILYIIGLFGDSYYGLVTNIPMISSAYELGFQYFSYTRNGLFFAPIFLFLGAMIGNRSQQHILSPAASSIGFIISFQLLLAEGIIVRNLHPKHHDNMYLLLIPCMLFLYQLLLKWKITLKSARRLRMLSTWIYILHPAVIVLVRVVGQSLKLTPILVENRLFFYGVVCVLSTIISWGIIVIMKKGRTVFLLYNRL